MLKPYLAIEDRSRYIFFDDFIGYGYDSTSWSLTGTMPFLLSCTGGQGALRAALSSAAALSHGDVTSFSVAKNAEIAWRIKVPTLTNMSYVKLGFQGNATYKATNYITFSITSTGNWQCTTTATTTTVVDSGIPYSTAFTEFRIKTITGNVLFLVNGLTVANIATTIPSVTLQPFLASAATSGGTFDVYIDYCQGIGDR